LQATTYSYQLPFEEFHSLLAEAGVTISPESTCEVLPMPVYDYICHDCNKSFETVLTLQEHDKEDIRCPKCGSKNVEQEVAEFFAVTGKKS